MAEKKKEMRWCGHCGRDVETDNGICPRCHKKTTYSSEEHMKALGKYAVREIQNCTAAMPGLNCDPEVIPGLTGPFEVNGFQGEEY